MHDGGIIAEDSSDLVNIMLPNGATKTGKIKFVCFRVRTAEDAEILNEYLSKGAEIALVTGEFIYTKIFEPSKLEMASANIGKK